MNNNPEGTRADTTLLGVSQEDYGPSYRDHILEIYKVYVEMADNIGVRREKANSFFLAVNTALIALLAKDIFGITSATPHYLNILVPVSAIVLCYLWYRIIRSYRDLNSAKYRVVHRIERMLPLCPYDAEWESVGRGKNSELYLPFTHVEYLVPWLFILFNTILIVSEIPWSSIFNSC